MRRSRDTPDRPPTTSSSAGDVTAEGRSTSSSGMAPRPPIAHKDMVAVPGGTFAMGSQHHYPEERPVHQVAVDGFLMDEHPVTNAEFRRFVKATGHVTV